MTSDLRLPCVLTPNEQPLESGPRKSRADDALARADRAGDVEASLIVRLVADAHEVTPAELFHHSRSRAPIATTRQIAMYLVHVLLGRTLTEVGAFFGRDRTTVAHGCARIEDMRDDAEFDSALCQLEDRIWSMLDGQAAVTDTVYAVGEMGAANDD